MKIYTVQLGKWRLAESRELPIINTTVKSGEKTFAPTKWMVHGHKYGDLTNEEYTAHFDTLMRDSWINNRARWLEVAHMDSVVLMCYCGAGCFCHRYLLVEMFRKICKLLGLPFEYMGDLESICDNTKHAEDK